MDYKEELAKLRTQIDDVDRQLRGLFNSRMDISKKVAEMKMKGNLPITDERREAEVLAVAQEESLENKAETLSFMRTLIALSKIKQINLSGLPGLVTFPESAPVPGPAQKVAYQGVAGAWGENGANVLYPEAALVNYEYFEDVFEAVKSGEVHVGVLPIENSQTGAIGEVYDLLKQHNCYIVGQTWIGVAHCLMGTSEAVLNDIRQVYSHPEGFAQCRRFLKNRSWDMETCQNTAIAAQTVSKQNNKKMAAIGSRRAAEIYGLQVLMPDIMDNELNQTRFIAIAAQPIYNENSDTISITFSTVHRSGALCSVLETFMLAGINLSRIESRPISPEKYRFFADLQANILSPTTLDALRQASAHCGYFEVLGCYGTT